MPIRVNKGGKKVRRKNIKLSAIKPPRRQAINYYQQLRIVTQELRRVGKRVKEMVETGEPLSLVNDFIFTQSNSINNRVSRITRQIADNFLGEIDKHTQQRLITSVSNALNVNAAQVALLPTTTELDTLNALREVFIAENVELIKTISPQYFQDLTQAISANFRGQPQKSAKSLAGRIQDIAGISDRRARFIARDQTAKVTSAMAHTRSQALGADKYIWRSAEDQRVVGNPSGLYPKPTRGHGNHFKRNGKTYFYNKPFADGLPGQAFGCRCVGEPVIDISKILFAEAA